MAQRVGPPLPPENFNLNAFLVEIAEEITEDDVNKMKSLLTGPGGIGRGILEDILKPIDFFQKLQTTGYLTVNDVLVLQALLWTIGKKEVYKKTVEFAEQSDDVLHVCTPNPEPVNGYKYVKFHLKGKVNKDVVEDLRERMSRWLRVPKHFVVISGVQPTGSWHITLMIPEICAENLHNFSSVKKEWLIQQDFETLELDGKVIDLTDSDGHKLDVTKGDDAACKELERLAEVNSDLENRIEILSSQLIKEQDAPIRFGSMNVIKRIDDEFAIHVEELQMLSSTVASQPHEILDHFVQKLQKNLEHIKHIREKRQTDFNSEYDKYMPDRPGKDDMFRRYLELLCYLEDSDKVEKLLKICRELEMSCLRLEFYLGTAEEDARELRLMAPQYGSASWIDRNLSVINQEMQTVEDFVKKYIEAIKITSRLIEEENPTEKSKTETFSPGKKEKKSSEVSSMGPGVVRSYLSNLADYLEIMDSPYPSSSGFEQRRPASFPGSESDIMLARLLKTAERLAEQQRQSSADNMLARLLKTAEGYPRQSVLEPILEPETPYPSTSSDATEETKASPSADESEHKHLGS